MRSAASTSCASSMQRHAAWQKPVDRPITNAAQTPLSAKWGSPSSQVSLSKKEGEFLWMECALDGGCVLRPPSKVHSGGRAGEIRGKKVP